MREVSEEGKEGVVLGEGTGKWGGLSLREHID